MEAAIERAANGAPTATPRGADRARPAAHRASSSEIDDPLARASAEELVGAVLELYGEGLERIFAAIAESRRAAASSRERLAGDGVVASLMLIHDLYPVALDERVVEALDSVRPYMESHGGNVELLGIEDGIARIRLEGSCDGCPASSSTLELAIKQALDEAAPDLEGLVVEGADRGRGRRRRRRGPGALELPWSRSATDPARRRAAAPAVVVRRSTGSRRSARAS